MCNNDIFDHCSNSPAQELCRVWLSSTHFYSPSTNHFMAPSSRVPELDFKSNFSWKIRCFSSIFEPFVSGLVLFTLLVYWYLHTSLKEKKKKKRPGMIYGPLQERNFLCRTPNLRGYGERSHWPYKYHGPSTESGWIFILLKKKKKKCQLGLIYDMQSKQRSTTPLFFDPCFWANVMEKEKKKKKEHFVPLLWSLITHMIDINLFVCNSKTIKAAGWVTKIKKMETVGNG